MAARLTALVGTADGQIGWEDAAQTLIAGRASLQDDSAPSWPFRRTVTPATPPEQPTAIVLRGLAQAFPAGQTGSTRLVLTQATYQLQRWLDWLALTPHVAAVADLSAAAPEVLREARARRGPWARIDVVEVAHAESQGRFGTGRSQLARAFRQTDAATRVDACQQAVTAAPEDPAILLAYASAAMELQRLDQSLGALERASEVAGDWEAVHFELGKLWLRADDTAHAAAAFAEAARLMPTFAAAHTNLGAALGELDRPLEALAALEHAALLDPYGHTVHNNIGANLRDIGRLADAETSFRRVVELAPQFVFGHYNLGHVLFLQGRFDEARRAYEKGLALDPARTAQQLGRLALACAASGDGPSACAHARAALEGAPEERRQEITDEMAETLDALQALQGASGAVGMLGRFLAADSPASDSTTDP